MSASADPSFDDLGEGKTDPKLLGAYKLLERTGVREIELRYSDDNEPTIWMAIARWQLDAHGMPVKQGGTTQYQCDAALGPLPALMRLCCRVIDGGQCMHCKRMTGFTASTKTRSAQPGVCWWRWYPASLSFERDCEQRR